jgi:hypothetical protein
VHLDWPEPLDGNEHGDVEYRLRREEWLPAPGVDLCETTAHPVAAPPDAGNTRGCCHASA